MYAFFNTHIANNSSFTNHLNADIFFFSTLYKLNGGRIVDLRGVMTSVVEADTMMVDIRCRELEKTSKDLKKIEFC